MDFWGKVGRGVWGGRVRSAQRSAARVLEMRVRGHDMGECGTRDGCMEVEVRMVGWDGSDLLIPDFTNFGYSCWPALRM